MSLTKSIFAIFLFVILLAIPSTALADASQCKPFSAPYTMKDRFGLSGNDGNNPLIADLGVSWYLNWGYKPDNNSASIEFLPMVLHSKSEDLSEDQFKTAIREEKSRNPNAFGNCTTWLIGNEVGLYVPGSGEDYPPEAYVGYFHKYADWIKALGEEFGATYKLAAGSVITRPDLELHIESKILPEPGPKKLYINGSLYMEKVLKIYKSKYGIPMPVDVFQLHPYMFDGTLEFKINKFQQSITTYRTMLKGQGYEGKELWITEWGNLIDDPKRKNDTSFEDSLKIMNKGIPWLASGNSITDGMRVDGNRLVQRWAWFTFKYLKDNPSYVWQHQYTYMYDSSTQQLNSLGLNYKRLIQQYTGSPTATPTPEGTHTPTPTPKPTDPDGVPGLRGDINGDKKFDIFDINEFVDRFGQVGGGKRDLNNSGKIDKEDLLILVEILKNSYGR